MIVGTLSRHRFSQVFRLLAAYLFSLILSSPHVYAATAERGKPSDADAQKLVVAAVEAELAGDITRRLPLLNAAIQKDPDNQLARWQLGQIQVDGKWVAVEEAQRRVAADPLQTEYRGRRTAATANVQDQLVLARWCRKNKLTSESELHWATVLSLDPTNEEALRSLDMRWKNGRIVGRNETQQDKQQAQAAKDAAKHWEPLIAKWRRAVGGREVSAHDAALVEIRAIDRVDAIPSLEPVTLGRDANDPDHAEECLQIAVAFIESLTKMPDQAATLSLVRHAVFSPGNKARNLAIEKLKSRPQTDFVPVLLSGLAMPIESSYDVRRYQDGSVHYLHSLYREGQQRDWSSNLRLSALQNDLGPPLHIETRIRRGGATVTIQPRPEPESNPIVRSRVSSNYANRYGRTVAATEAQVAAVNANTELLNGIIMQVLISTTGKELETPRAWWDWWTDENHYEKGTERPVDNHYYARTDKYNYGGPTYATIGPTGRSGSCFAKGTLVWTNSGKRPIELLELGDLILSQNIDTGELTCKPVVYRTVRLPSPMVRIKTEDDEIATTLGHPFWVAGIGWRMAKELEDGAILHDVSGAARIRSIEPAEEAEAYNLVVADFNTYFVGESGVLVHDNTPRHSARVAVPGIEVK